MGLAGYMEVVPRDVRAAIRGLHLLLNLAFIGGGKEEYSAHLRLLSARLRRGSAGSQRDITTHELAGFLREMTEARCWMTTILPAGQAGISCQSKPTELFATRRMSGSASLTLAMSL